MIFDYVFLRFIGVGAMNTLFGAGMMFLLYNLAGAGYWISSFVSYVIASVLSFFLNKYFTFRAKDWSARQVIGFAGTIAVSYVLAYGIAKPIVSIIFSGFGERIRDNIALFAGMCLFTVLNYIGQRFVAFKVASK
jgi:putative flippase GtrA